MGFLLDSVQNERESGWEKIVHAWSGAHLAVMIGEAGCSRFW
ncbi:unnamed protein product [Anisakis simplex]|uniref:Transcriptional regulator n=1 Tax=Anisakis simplex TaxID=6269 RepID=A0A0M3JFY1_ANISI|nr:unnamed protein product [Anisakis simplex]